MNISNLGSNIRRYMKLQGLTISNLSSRMGIGSATLSNILNSKSEPRSSTLLKFSDVLGVSVNDLLSESPKLQRLRFRTLKRLSAREKAERDQILNSAAQWLKDYKELEDMLGEHIPYSFNDVKNGNPEELAMEARKRIEIKNPEEPVYDIADRIERAGIKLLICNFGFKKTFGLSAADNEKGPAIIVNSESSFPIERQIFTIAHELGHLLMHADSYGKSSEEQEIIKQEIVKKEENEADTFAGHFLLPNDALISEWRESSGLDWVEAVLKIKKEYKVSYKTVLVRLSQINNALDLSDLLAKFSYIYKQRYNHDLKNHYEPDALQDPVAPDDPQALSKHDLVEDRYAKLVRLAYEKRIISMSRAGELLKKTVLEMRDLIKSWQDISINA